MIAAESTREVFIQFLLAVFQFDLQVAFDPLLELFLSFLFS